MQLAFYSDFVGTISPSFAKDKKLILEIIENEKDILKRNNKKYHFTVSTWIVSPNRKKF